MVEIGIHIVNKSTFCSFCVLDSYWLSGRLDLARVRLRLRHPSWIMLHVYYFLCQPFSFQLRRDVQVLLCRRTPCISLQQLLPCAVRKGSGASLINGLLFLFVASNTPYVFVEKWLISTKGLGFLKKCLGSQTLRLVSECRRDDCVDFQNKTLRSQGLGFSDNRWEIQGLDFLTNTQGVLTNVRRS